MDKKKDEDDAHVLKNKKPFRVLFRTQSQREKENRNEAIVKRFLREYEKGSDKMYIYELLSQIYCLSVSQIGYICRKGVKDARA